MNQRYAIKCISDSITGIA